MRQLSIMKADKLQSFLRQAIPAGVRLLVLGAPGIGKTDSIHSVAEDLNYNVLTMHPAVSDPTDFKGLPARQVDEKGRFLDSGEFLPYGDLLQLIRAEKPTIAFADDIGQAPPAVQAGLMQLILARQVNGKKISDKVVFVGATNDTSHMAGVSGMIEPLKSRWDSIVTMDVDLDTWCKWAYKQDNFPAEVVGFIRFKPTLLSDFKPTKELKNSPSPRGWASVAKLLAMGCGDKDVEIFSGAVGQGAAAEFVSFLQMHRELPSLDSILMNPKSAPIPEKPCLKYAVACGLARKATEKNFENVVNYMSRKEMGGEFDVVCVKDAVDRDPNLTKTSAFVNWSVLRQNLLS
jgi:hypothetical protein